MRPPARLTLPLPVSSPTDSSTDHLLEADHLEKWFGGYPAVRGISFTLDPGEFVVLFGPNGAGKTTLLRMLAGSLRPTHGAIRFAGADGGSDDWRARIGVLSHQTYLYGQLTARENLRFYGRLYGLEDAAARIVELLEDVELIDRADDLVRTYSRGMQQRLALARTLLHDPELVLLDEPYTGLDPHAARMLRGVLGRLRDGRRTVFMVTHNLAEGLEMADRVIVQAGGVWVSDEPRKEIDPQTFAEVYSERVGGAV